jgi:hypothetical protein
MKNMTGDAEGEKKGGLLGEVDGSSEAAPVGNAEDGQIMGPPGDMGAAVKAEASDEPPQQINAASLPGKSG